MRWIPMQTKSGCFVYSADNRFLYSSRKARWDEKPVAEEGDIFIISDQFIFADIIVVMIHGMIYYSSLFTLSKMVSVSYNLNTSTHVRAHELQKLIEKFEITA